MKAISELGYEEARDELIEVVARAIDLADHSPNRVPDGFANGFPDDLSDWDVWISTAVIAALRGAMVPVAYKVDYPEYDEPLYGPDFNPLLPAEEAEGYTMTPLFAWPKESK